MRRRVYNLAQRAALEAWLAPREGELILHAQTPRPLAQVAAAASGALGFDIPPNMIGRVLHGLRARGRWWLWRGEYLRVADERPPAGLAAAGWGELRHGLAAVLRIPGAESWSDPAVALALRCLKPPLRTPVSVAAVWALRAEIGRGEPQARSAAENAEGAESPRMISPISIQNSASSACSAVKSGSGA